MTDRPSRLVLLGHPVGHSLSPVFQNAALRSAGIPLSYEALDVPPAALPAVASVLARERAAGNVTIPHKERFRSLCAAVTEPAGRSGAVNTFWVERGRLHGDNTDVGAIDASVRALLGAEPAGLRVALLGAGGGALAVLAAAARWDRCWVAVYNRTPERAEAAARRFGALVRPVRTVPDLLAGAHLVVNASPVGMRDEAHPLPLDLVPPGAAVLDLVYRLGETAWVRAARERGLRAMDGLPMLIEQGALAFERWLGIPAPRDVMRAALAHPVAE